MLGRGEIASLLDKGRILEERLESEKALTLELAAKYQHMDALEKEKAFSARLAAKCHDIEALEAKKGVELELKSAREEIALFKKKLSSLELKIQEEKALSAEFTRRYHDREALDVQRNELKSQLQSANSEIVDLNEKVKMLEEIVEKRKPLTAELESQLKSAQAEIKNLKENVNLLEKKLESQKNLSSALHASEAQKNKSAVFAAQCQNLKEEFSSRAPAHQPVKPMASKSLHIKKEKELAHAAGKLADCQKTIASLSRQLKSLADFDEFMPVVENDDALTESWDGDLKLFDSASYPAQFGCLAVT